MKTKAPLRISFAGGGTDIEPYVSDYGSYILSAAITLYNRAIYPTSENTENITSRIEQMLSDIAGKGRVQLLSDLEPETGLGGSASCFVAGLKAIYPDLDKEKLARLAFYLERKVMKIEGGIQDQICAAYGGLLFITLEGGAFNIESLDLQDNFNRFLVLVSVGKRRIPANDIIKDQLRCYDVKVFHRQKQLARLLRESLIAKRYIDFGKLLDEAWQCKKRQSSLVSHPEIDEMYAKFLSLGCIGGVLPGAGAGGYMLLMEHPEKEGELRFNLLRNNLTFHNVEFDTLGAREI